MELAGYRRAALAGGAVVYVTLCIPAYAQDAVLLPEISVFGEKTEKSSADTTTSVGIVTGERIEQEQILDFQQSINSVVNALSTRASQNNGGITIRGINSEGLSQNQSASSAPLIAVIVDGAMQNAEAVRRGVRSVWDVEQVEVLRGPQSTLQGRNAAAGAVFIKTRDPTFTWQAFAEAMIGAHDLRSLGVMVSGPIVENELAFRIAGQIQRSNMDITYTDPANRVLGENRFHNIRGKILWQPSGIPGLRALFTIAHTDDRPGVNAVTGPDYFARVFDSASTFIDFRATKTNNYISDVSYAFLPSMKLRSVTSFAATETDIDSAPGQTLYVRDDVRKGGDFTQDLRLEIDNAGNGLSGVLGLYYGNFTTRIDSRFGVDASLFVPIPPGLVFQPIQDLDAHYETQSIAAYADLGYRFDRWRVIFGGRAFEDNVTSHATGMQFNGAFLMPLDNRTDATFSGFLPKLGLTYDLTPAQTVGFTYSEGYRQGFTDIFPLTGQVFNVRPEYLKSYEISYRSHWFDNRLALNANAFYYDYRDQQVAYEPGPLPGYAVITNANKSHAYGAEFESRLRATDHLTLYAAIGLLYTKFDDIVIPTVGNFSGNQFPEAPGYTVNAGAMYKDPSGWFAGANARFVDGYYSNGDLQNTPLRYVDSAVIVDARVGWEHNNMKLTLFAKNLLDERYLTYISLGGTQAGVGDSRLIGFSLSAKL